ncbi:MAG: biopolymer transporter ExbD [Pseudomonadota bacterium]
MLRKARRRRVISVTSLIDVIFLLLLFFMLTSTFTRFAELPLSAATAGASLAADRPPLFLRLEPEAVSLNGEVLRLGALVSRLGNEDADTLLVSLTPDVTAQRLTDLLVTLAPLDGLNVTVLE